MLGRAGESASRSGILGVSAALVGEAESRSRSMGEGCNVMCELAQYSVVAEWRRSEESGANTRARY